MSEKLLKALNPRANFRKAGERIQVVSVLRKPLEMPVERIEAVKKTGMLVVFGPSDAILAKLSRHNRQRWHAFTRRRISNRADRTQADLPLRPREKLPARPQQEEAHSAAGPKQSGRYGLDRTV